MSRKDAISLVSRAIALYLTFWALAELTNLPVRVLSFVHSVTAERMAPNMQYLRQYYLMEVAFLLTRVVGLSVLALWFHKCGPGVEALLQPPRSEAEGAAIQN